MTVKPLTAGRVARRILAFYNNDPNKWTKGGFGRDLMGELLPLSWINEAVCCCPLGVVGRVLLQAGVKNPASHVRFDEAWDALNQAVGEPFSCLNDSCQDFSEIKKILHKISRTP